MGIASWIFGDKSKEAGVNSEERFVSPRAEGMNFAGLNDPALLEYIRSGGSPNGSLQVSAVYRCVSLISNAIGMLPLRIVRKTGAKAFEEAVDHPLFNVLMYEPNSYQTGFEFRQLMQTRILSHGNAYARIVRTGDRVVALLPIDPSTVTPDLRSDGEIIYKIRSSDGSFDIQQRDMFHLRGLTTDGVEGVSAVEMAAEAIGLSREASNSLLRIYKNGVSAGGVLRHPNRLSPEARARLKAGLEDFSGSSNAGKFLVLDEGIEAKYLEQTAKDSQTLETAKHQIEDISRFFGVPRPLMNMDDTSWGSGVEQLAILFVRFALAPYFVSWENAVYRSLFSRADKRNYRADFDERELLRGSMKDQAEFYAKASGSGGHMPWMMPNEIRQDVGLGPLPGGDQLLSPSQAGGQTGTTSNDNSQTSNNQGV